MAYLNGFSYGKLFLVVCQVNQYFEPLLVDIILLVAECSSVLKV